MEFIRKQLVGANVISTALSISVVQLLRGSERNQYITAMNEEIKALHENKAYKSVLRTMWIFTYKHDLDRHIIAHKAHLVIIISQQNINSLSEIYAPTST